MINAGLLSKNRTNSFSSRDPLSFYEDNLGINTIAQGLEEQLNYETTISLFLNKLINKYYDNKNTLRLEFLDTENTYRFVLYPTSFYAREVTRDRLKSIVNNKNFKYKYFNEKDFKVVVILPLNIKKYGGKWKPQFDFVQLFPNFSNLISDLNSYISKAKRVLSHDFGIFILDVTRFLMELREGYFTPGKLISNFITLFTLNFRYKKMFAQTNNLTDLLMGLAALGLPQRLLDQVKNFSTLTGRRIFDNDFLMDGACAVFELLISIIDYFAESQNSFVPVALASQVSVFLKRIGAKFIAYKKIKKIAHLYSQFVKDGSKMFDPTFRQDIKIMYDECSGDNAFLDFVLNGTNGYFKTTWTLFKENVVKSAMSFETASREEPLCLVFEGEAGSGKSVLMTQYVELLRARGTTVYTHNVPAAEDGKDFYDDYANQEVFVMDDIGQQGKSQWRYIINYVSPVKYPLPCANAALKNTKFFNSKIILCTTNALMNLSGFTSTDCISTPDALFRRCHVIKVEKTQGETFNQTLRYYKYDFRASQKWVNGFLYHQATQDINPILTTQDGDILHQTLKYVHKIVTHIQHADSLDRGNLVRDNLFYQNIIDEVEENYQDATDFRPHSLSNLAIPLCDAVDFVKLFITELVSTVSSNVDEMYKLISRMITTGVQTVFCDLFNIEINMVTGVTLIALLSLIGAYFCFYNGNDAVKSKMVVSKQDENVLQYYPQAANERIEVIKRFCKTVVVKDTFTTYISQGIVSGDKIMLPAHLDIGQKFLDIYTTYEHYENGHKEMENLQVVLVKAYMSIDIAIYKVTKAIPLWKHCNNLFVANQQLNPVYYLVNSIKSVPVVMGLSVVRNTDVVSYSAYVSGENKTFTHERDTGYYTGITAEGLCGTVLCSNDGGIIGFHVAGNSSDVGFCVAPSGQISEEIRTIMLQGKEPQFEIDRKVIPGISGVRLRYDQMDVTHVGGESQFTKTLFHRELCPEINDLEQHISVYTDAIKVDKKAPPNFKNKGSPTVLLKEISKKTMKHQGMVTHPELQYIKECISTLIPTFDDIEDEVVAFGSNTIPPLNKDSSNGYGCAKSKDEYFDFDAKIIKQEAYVVINRFYRASQERDYDPKLFVCRETFKDELRKEDKVNTPRTFRVMPMPHIWWTKKIFGSLGPYYKENIHNTGVCLGLNPYVDFSLIHAKLKDCSLHGDVDFSKWDGSIMAPIMQLIGDIFREKYKGEHGHMIEYLFNTMSTSMVMVSDELWATTHGLPSGTWLTLLLNCLLNRALTALTLYRNIQRPTIDDFNAIVDYVTGDDKIFGVPEEYGDVFNLLTLSKTATSLGMECTNGDKTPITTRSQDFTKLNFVKRDFHYHPQLQAIVGKLSIDTIMNTLQWYDTSKELNECIEGKMRSVQVESYLHSRALFLQLTSIFKKYYPLAYFLTEERVKKILDSKEGYNLVMTGLGKDMSFNM